MWFSLFLILIFMSSNNMNTSEHRGESEKNMHFYELELIPNNREFYADELITVVFKNRYASVVHLIRRSSNSPILQLQKYNIDENRWRNLSTARPGTVGQQVIRYRELRFGESIRVDFPAERLEELGKDISGTYRYRLSYSLSRNTSDMVTIYSPVFMIY